MKQENVNKDTANRLDGKEVHFTTVVDNKTGEWRVLMQTAGASSVEFGLETRNRTVAEKRLQLVKNWVSKDGYNAFAYKLQTNNKEGKRMFAGRPLTGEGGHHDVIGNHWSKKMKREPKSMKDLRAEGKKKLEQLMASGVGKKRIFINFQSNLLSALEAEADKAGRTKSDIVNDMIHERYTIKDQAKLAIEIVELRKRIEQADKREAISKKVIQDYHVHTQALKEALDIERERTKNRADDLASWAHEHDCRGDNDADKWLSDLIAKEEEAPKKGFLHRFIGFFKKGK